MDNITEYLNNKWDLCVRENHEDCGSLIGLPYKYTVPSVESFDEIYYWDTYFTNVGLLRIGRKELAKSNVDNMFFLIKRFGFMPNGNRTYYLNRSQPPFLSEMVSDIYNCFKDKEWLKTAYNALLSEYDFWMTKRISDIGLNHYDVDLKEKEIKSAANAFAERIGYRPELSDYDIARHFLATAESGWDLTPRWEFDAYNYATIELNSLMYMLEKNMERFSEIIGENKAAKLWNERANTRLALINKYLIDEEGMFTDYNFKLKKHSSVFSAAAYFTLFAGIATAEQAQLLADNLPRLEEKYGVAACEKGDFDIIYQWGHPNGWACLQYILIAGFDRYGYKDIAKRLAEKYVTLAEKNFKETNNFWEKYNVAEGNINVSNEYKMPTMLGWSAGAYVYAKSYLEQ